MTLLTELQNHLSGLNIDWHLCGGFAIDLFLGKTTRTHKDLDITVSFNDMKPCIVYLQSKGWRIDAPIGGGRFLPIDEALKNAPNSFDNIWCYKEDADFITESRKGAFLSLDMNRTSQTHLDFIEVLFNRVENHQFIYLKNPNVTLSVDKAFQKIGDISILSPELILLYKSRNTENPDYEQDFALTVPHLNHAQKEWLANALKVEYPKGHPWAKGIY